MPKNIIPFLGLFMVIASLCYMSCHDTISEEPIMPKQGPYDTQVLPPKTILPGPPPPSPYDYMLGDYIGTCRNYRVDFDFSNGQYSYSKDTFEQVVNVLKVEEYGDDHLIVRTYGSHFPLEFIVSPEELIADTIRFGDIWSGSKTIITIVPASSFLYLYHIAYSPYGPGQYELWCNCYKGN